MADPMDVEEVSMRMGPRMELKKCVNLEDLLSSKGAKFEIDEGGWMNYDSSSDEEEDKTHQRLRLALGSDDKPMADNEILLNQSMLNFNEVEAQAESIHETGYVKKVVLRKGKGAKVTPDAKVYVRYVAFAEGMLQPFDERRKPYGIFLGNEESVIGLRVGLRTMAVGEISRLLVYPRFAFGELGCAPRIPKGARIIFTVEMINFVRKEYFDDVYHMSADDRNQLSFKEIFEAARTCNRKGNGYYDAKDYIEALKWYSKGIVLLEDYSTVNVPDNDARDEFLPSMCCNKAQALLVLKSFERCCTVCKLGLRTAKSEMRAKLLARFAKAKSELQAFKGAREMCEEAIRIFKNTGTMNATYDKLLKEILAAERTYCASEKQNYKTMCKRMFQHE